QLTRARISLERCVEPNGARHRVECVGRDGNRVATGARTQSVGITRGATLTHGVEGTSRVARKSGNHVRASNATRPERARLTHVQDGWRVRVPASSANIGPGF